MNIREIVKNIFYVGVNDRVTHRFEALWPLPNGVSYNSYIAVGTEKVALIDTVSVDEVREFFNNIDTITKGAKIDYLVINHMEPDHSGSIREVAAAYPDLKIVGNSKTIEMVKGFYHVDDNRFLEIKDGDSIDLGGRILKFYLTPMVHWPETMMTYVEDARLIFSGDAFGTFGALNGGLIDRDMDTDVYIREMYRYYSNIVGKYGRFVEKALEKLKDLPIEYICSTHGPVWNEKIPEVMEIVKGLAAYRSEPGAVIIYGSMYGNTAEVAEMIARRLSAQGVKKIIIHNASHSSMSDMISDAFRYEILIVGSATYSMTLMPPVDTFMIAMVTREIKNKVLGFFGGYTWAKGAVTGKLSTYAERLGIDPSATLIYKQSVDDETRAAVTEFANNILKAANVTAAK